MSRKDTRNDFKKRWVFSHWRNTTQSNISSAAGASDSNSRHTAPPINVFDIDIDIDIVELWTMTQQTANAGGAKQCMARQVSNMIQ